MLANRLQVKQTTKINNKTKTNKRTKNTQLPVSQLKDSTNRPNATQSPCHLPVPAVQELKFKCSELVSRACTNNQKLPSFAMWETYKDRRKKKSNMIGISKKSDRDNNVWHKVTVLPASHNILHGLPFPEVTAEARQARLGTSVHGAFSLV